MPPIEQCCCFTGHRKIPAGMHVLLADRVETAVLSLYHRGVTTFYAGGAFGFDLLASVTLLNLKSIHPDLSLLLALPCRDHDAQWNDDDRDVMKRVTSRADGVVYVSEDYSSGCMMKRNRYMVDRSLYCLCYLTEEKGGTASTVRYAEKKNRIVENLAPGSLSQLSLL